MQMFPSREAQSFRVRLTHACRCLLTVAAALLCASTTVRADEPRLRDLVFDPTIIQLAPGESIDVTVWGLYDDDSLEDLTGEVTLSSRDPESAVTSGNTITALAGGNAVIDAEHPATGTGADDKAEVAVLEVVELAITPALSTITAGTSVQLFALATLEDGRTGWDMTDFVEWEIDIKDVASVDQSGLVTGLSEGVTEVEVQDPESGVKSPGETHFIEVLPGGGGGEPENPAEVDQVVVAPLHSNLLPGETVELVVTLIFDDGSQQVCTTCTFRSSRSGVAQVSSGGRVTAVGAGETPIKVEHPGSGRSAEDDPEIWVGDIEQIDLSPRGASIGTGETIAFRALASYDNGRVLDITETALWSSNDNDVATVSDTPGSKGLVLGVDLGGAEITARDRDSGVESDRDDGEVIVSLAPGEDPGGEVGEGAFDPNEVRSVVVDPPVVHLFPGDETQVTVYAILKDGTSRDITDRAEFKVRSRDVASAAPGGMITALEGGETFIRAEDPLSRKRTRQGLRVRVTQMTALRVEPAEVDLQAGEQIQLKAYADFDDGSIDIDVTDLVWWESDRESVATVGNTTSKGLLAAISEGTARIRAEDPASGERSDGSTGQVTVDGALPSDPTEIVELRFEPATVVLDPETVGQVAVKGVQLDGTIVDLDVDDLRFKSESRRVVSIGRDNTLVARRGGRTRVVVEHRPTETEASFHVTVRAIEFLRIAPGTVALRVGQSMDLAAWGSFNDGSPDEQIEDGLSWRSRERSVVQVDSRDIPGRITALSEGTGLIEVRHRDSRTRSDGSSGIVRVVGDPVRVFVMPEFAAVEVGAEQQFEAFGVFEDGTVLNISDAVSWSLSDVRFATIDPNGLLTLLAPGTFEVRAKDQGTNLSSNDTEGNATVSTAGGLTGLAVSENNDLPEAPTMIDLAAGEAILLKGLGVFPGAPLPADLTSSLVWTSSNPAAVPVDGAGLVSCAALGVAQISVREPLSGIRSTDTLGDATINCAGDVTGLKVTPLEADLDFPNSRQMRAFRVFNDGREVEVTERVIWTSSDPDALPIVETGAEGGRVTALDDTIATISAFDPAFNRSSNDAGGQNGTVNVRKTRSFLEIFPLDPEPDEDGVYRVRVGDVIRFRARVTYVSGVTQGVNVLVQWQSSDDGVLLMSPPDVNVNWGNALSTGTVTVTARWAADEFSPEITDTVTVEVLAAAGDPTGLAVSEGDTIPATPAVVDLASGQTTQLKGLAMLPGAGSPTDLTGSLSWTSSNPTAIAIDGPGLVRCASAGTAQVSVEHPGSGVRSTDTLGDATVNCAGTATGAVIALKVTPDEANLDFPKSRNMRAWHVLDNGDEIEVTDQVVWTSSDPAALSIVQSGVDAGRVTAIDDVIATVSAFDPTLGISSNDAGGQNGIVNVRKTRTLLEIFPLDPLPDGDGVYRVQVGDVIRFKARVTFITGITQGVNVLVEWQSNDESVLLMSPPGVNVNWGNALTPGTVTVTARWAADEFSPELTDTVTVEVLP